MRRIGLALGIAAVTSASTARADAPREGWFEAASHFFAFGPEHKVGLVPSVLVDYGLRSSVGAYFFWDDFLAPGNDLRAHAAVGGADWVHVTLADRLVLDPRSTLKLRAEAMIRPDQTFYGIGARAREASPESYGTRSLEVGLSLHLDLSPHVSLDPWASVKSESFEPFPASAPTGFGGYTALREGLRFALDSRQPHPTAHAGGSRSGVRFTGEVEHAIDLRDANRWIRYGSAATLALELGGPGRVLSLTTAARFADPLGDAEVPFTELISLGGDEPMRGFLANRLLGRSAATAAIEYRHPLGSFFDGSLHATIGNVFGAYLQDFEPNLCRLAFDVGLATTGPRDHAWDLLVGFGTETFIDGTRPNTVRILFGGAPGF